MGRPYALLRAGFPYVKTLGMRRVTNFPVDLAVGGNVIYVLCRSEIATYIRRLSLDDDDLGVIGSLGTKDGQLTWPVSVIMDSEETLFVSDEACHRISRFGKDGEFLGKWGEQGDGDGQIDGPSGLAFDGEENIYLADSLNHRVQKFTKDGELLTKWGSFGDGEGQFNMPWGVAVDEVGDVYVADWRNDRVQKFSSDGEFIFAIGRSGSADGEFCRPPGVEVDADGDIYVADSGNNRVQLFDSQGRFVEKFIGDATLSKSGREYMINNAVPLRLREMANLEPQKRLRGVRAVRVDDEGRMYVPDYGSYRVQVYQKEGIPLTDAQIAPPISSPRLMTT